MTISNNNSIPCRRAVLFFGAVTVFIGVAVLAGWALKLPLVTTLGAGLIPTAPITALLFVLNGAAVFLVAFRGGGKSFSAGKAAGALALVIAAPLVVLSAKGILLQIEHLGFYDLGPVAGFPAGYISVVTAACFVLAGLSFFSSVWAPDKRNCAKTAFAFSSLLAAVCAVLLLAYLLDVPLMYGGSFIPPALPTAAALSTLGAALAFYSFPRAWPIKYDTDMEQRTAYTLAAFFVLLAAGVVAAGYFSYERYEKQYLNSVENNLASIADMKVAELQHWRAERLGDAALFYGNANYSRRLALYLRDPKAENSGERLHVWLDKLISSFGYNRVYQYDANGVELMSSPETPAPRDVFLEHRAADAAKGGKVVFVDFYRNRADGRIYLAVLSPNIDEKSGKVIGVLAFRIDPEKHLYPYIKLWPSPSKSAETLLVRREDGHVLFLNELRFKKGAALNLRRPVSMKDLPAVKAATGIYTVEQGVDYRGVPVFAATRAVPGTPWGLVARIDSSEVYAPLRERMWSMVLVICLLIAVSGFGIQFIWRRQKTRVLRERLDAADALFQTEGRYLATLMSIGDGVIVTDSEGRVELLNPIAEELTGWDMREAIGKPVEEVFNIVNEETRKPASNPVRRVLREGRIVGLANHTAVISRKGPEYSIADSGAPIWGKKGDSAGVVLVFRDQTEEKNRRAERELSINILKEITTEQPTRDTMRGILTLLQAWAGCDAVGLRLKEGDDYPYYETRGFSGDFVQSEKYLCVRDENGEPIRDAEGLPVYECMCGNILCGRCDAAKSFFTSKGSFWSNRTSELLASTTDAERMARTRNRCNGEGYETVVLIRLYSGGETHGLLQFNDHSKDKFTAQQITFLENIADQIAVAISRRNASVALAESEEKYRSLFEHMNEGYAYCRMIYENGKPVDFIHLDVNSKFENLTGLKDAVGKKVSELISGIHEVDPVILEVYSSVVETGVPQKIEVFMHSMDMWFLVSVYSPRNEHFVTIFDNITARKQAEARQKFTAEILSELNKEGKYGDTITAIAERIREYLNIDAVGIRLRKGDDYPYYVSTGFSTYFMESGNSICARDGEGNIAFDAAGNRVLDCLCGSVLSGNIDQSLPCFTSGGSFWTNRLPELLSSPAESSGRPAANIQSHCIKEGCESLALVPLRLGDDVIGLIHLCDHGKDRFNPGQISFMEEIAASISIALSKKMSRDSLQEREERMRLAISGGDLGTWDWDISTGKVINNERWAEMIGYTLDETKHDTSDWDKFTHPDDVPLVNEALRAHLEGRAEFYEIEHRMRHKSGEWIWVLDRGEVISRDEDGKPLRMVGTHLDITERKHAEETIKQKEELLRMTGEMAKIGGWEFDANTFKGTWTDEVARIHDLDPSIETNVELGISYYEGEMREKMEYAIREAIEHGSPYDLELEITTAINKKKWIRTIGIPVVEDNKVVRVKGIIQDITIQKKSSVRQEALQQQLLQSQKMETIGTLAGGVAHDYNNMLAVILGNAQLAKSSVPAGSPLEENLADIEDAALRAKELTMQLLTFARKEKVFVRPVDINGVIKDLAALLKRSFLKKITIKTVLGEGLPNVSIDSNQMHQVFLNICNNARDAMPGGGRLIIESSRVVVDEDYASRLVDVAPGPYCLVQISDTGIGMIEEVKKRIFEPFYTTKGVGKGTGLGLPVSYGIVKNHGGFIHVYSEPGKGTSFKLYIPFAEGDATANPAKARRDIRRGNETIMVIDDEPAVLNIAGKILKTAGYDVILVDGGKKAIDVFRERRDEISLVVLDMVMPEMDGQMVFIELKAIAPDVRVVLSSGYSINGQASGMMEEGVLGFVQKPFDIAEFCNTVREAIDG